MLGLAAVCLPVRADLMGSNVEAKVLNTTANPPTLISGPATAFVGAGVEFDVADLTFAVIDINGATVNYNNIFPSAPFALTNNESYVLTVLDWGASPPQNIIGFDAASVTFGSLSMAPIFSFTPQSFTMTLPAGTVISDSDPQDSNFDAFVSVRLLFQPQDNGPGPGGAEVPEPISFAIWSLLGVGAFGARRVWRPAAQ